MLDDSRRALPEKEPWRAFAVRQIERIRDHVAKEAWEDNFDRTGGASSNSWDVDEASGPTFLIADGHMRLRGGFNASKGLARLYRRYASTEFVSIEMDVLVKAKDENGNETRARAGMFVGREKRQGNTLQTTSRISVERHPEGHLQVLLMDRTSAEPDRERVDIAPVGGVPWWPADKPVRLRIERLGEGSDSVGRISVDGIPVAEGFKMSVIAMSGDVVVGLFAEGDTGQRVELEIDNVQVVKRRAVR